MSSLRNQMDTESRQELIAAREAMSPVALVALSRWIDAGNAHRDPEAVTWGRLAKVSEECGEVIAAHIGATGQNPRKGVTCSQDDVIEELLDVAVTALGAIEHLTNHDGDAMERLDEKIIRVATRAGLLPASPVEDDEQVDEDAFYENNLVRLANGDPLPA